MSCCALLTGLRLLVETRSGSAGLCLQISKTEEGVTTYYQSHEHRTYREYRMTVGGAWLGPCLDTTFTEELTDIWDCESKVTDFVSHDDCPPTGYVEDRPADAEHDWNDEIVPESYWGVDKTNAEANLSGWTAHGPADPSFDTYALPPQVEDYPYANLSGFTFTEASAGWDATYYLKEVRWKIENDGPVPVTFFWEEVERNENNHEMSRTQHSTLVPANGSTGWMTLPTPTPTHRPIDWEPVETGDNGYLSRAIESTNLAAAGVGWNPFA